MERIYLTSIGLVIGCVLFLQAGCEKQVSSPAEPETALVEPEVARLDESPAAVPTVAPEKAETPPESNTPSQGDVAISAEPAAPAPKITFESLVCDFGEVEPGQKKGGEFKFKNTGEGTLKITQIDKCCGAVINLSKAEFAAGVSGTSTEPSWTTVAMPAEFAPGESGRLAVEYSSSYRPGAMTRQIHVNSNDVENPRVTLTIKATITTKVDYEPKSINLLLSQENAGCPEITITSLDKRPFSIKSFKSPDDCITADVNFSEEATSFVLKPKVDIEKLKKRLNGYIEIYLTHPAYSQVSIVFNTLPRFKTDPYVIIIKDAESQKPVKRDVWVFNNYGEDFEIDSTSSKSGNIKVLSQEKISNGYHLVVEVTPPVAEGGQMVFTDSFTINIKGGESLEIECRGFYLPPPAHSSS
jgi:hypothetical protein